MLEMDIERMELELYKKMYAIAVGGMDDTLQMIAKALTEGNCGRETLIAVGEKLKAAFLAAEELYIYAEDDYDEEDYGAEER